MIHDWNEEKIMPEITMVMPVYGGNMVDDEQHGRNQTWAKIARKHFFLELQRGSALLLAQTSLGDRIGNVPSWLYWVAAKPLGVPLCFLQDIGVGNSLLVYSIYSFFCQSAVNPTQ